MPTCLAYSKHYVLARSRGEEMEPDHFWYGSREGELWCWQAWRGVRGQLPNQRQPGERGSLHSAWKAGSRNAAIRWRHHKNIASFAQFCLHLAGGLSSPGTKLFLILAGVHETDILEFVFLHGKKKRKKTQQTWLTVTGEEKCACLQTCGLQIAYNSHITVCHQNTSAWRDHSYCHPFTFNFNLHEIMFFVLHFSQFFSSPPLFIFPYHLKVPPFSNVIVFGCNVLHLYPSNKRIIFVSSLRPLWSHFLAKKLNLEKNNKLTI